MENPSVSSTDFTYGLKTKLYWHLRIPTVWKHHRSLHCRLSTSLPLITIELPMITPINHHCQWWQQRIFFFFPRSCHDCSSHHQLELITALQLSSSSSSLSRINGSNSWSTHRSVIITLSSSAINQTPAVSPSRSISPSVCIWMQAYFVHHSVSVNNQQLHSLLSANNIIISVNYIITDSHLIRDSSFVF